MLPKNLRLKGAEVSRVLSNRTDGYQCRSFRLKVRKRKDEEKSCFAIIVSGRVAKKAVVRNKIKRIFSKALESLVKEIKKGFDLVFILRRSVLDKPGDEIKMEIKTLLQKTNFLK